MKTPASALSLPRARLLVLARRVGLVLGALLGIGAIAVAALLARLDLAAIQGAAVTALEAQSGLRFHTETRVESYFPRPRITFQKASFTRPDGSRALAAGQMILKLDLLDLADGVVDAPEIVLVDVESEVAASPDAAIRSPRALTDLLESASSAFEGITLSRLRLAFENARITVIDPQNHRSRLTVGPGAMVMRYSKNRGRIEAELSQSGTVLPDSPTPVAQQPGRIQISLPTRHALKQGKAHDSLIDARWGDTQFHFKGKARAEPEIVLQGKIEAGLGNSFNQILSWNAPLKGDPNAQIRLRSGFSLDARGIGLDNLEIANGGRSLAGIAALREANNRWSLSATLAGDLVDGTAAHRALQNIRDKDGQWSRAPLRINPLPQLDLDLRLSTKNFRLGSFSLRDVALSILARPNRTEMAIVDSRFGAGTFKARVNVGDGENNEQTLRVSLSGEDIEGGDVLQHAMGFDRLTGKGSFIAQLQGKGMNVAALVQSLGGSAALDLKNGSINGIDLNRLMTRVAEQKSPTALLFSMVGKTPYERLRADFTLNGGKLNVVGSSFATPTVEASLEGYSDISAQQHHLSIALRKHAVDLERGQDFFAFKVEGPLLSPSIKPDKTLLEERG